MRRAAALAVALALWAAPATAGQAATVQYVHDADTLTVLAGGREARVRLVGVDAPEMRYSKGLDRRARRGGRAPDTEAAAGRLARQAALALAGKGDEVSLEPDTNGGHDRYGRRLAYVRLADGQDLGAALIAGGWARAYRRFAFDRRAEYERLENEARRARRGLWGGLGNGLGP